MVNSWRCNLSTLWLQPITSRPMPNMPNDRQHSFKGHFPKDKADKTVQECLHSGFYSAKNDRDGVDNRTYNMCEAPFKLLPSTNQHPAFYRLDALPVAKPMVSKHWREKVSHSMDLFTPNSPVVLQPHLRKLKVVTLWGGLPNLSNGRICILYMQVINKDTADERTVAFSSARERSSSCLWNDSILSSTVPNLSRCASSALEYCASTLANCSSAMNVNNVSK